MTSPDPEHPEGPPPEDERRYPSTIGGMFYLLVLVVITAALVVASVTDEWRTGVRIMGGALVFGAFVRLVLRARDAGMLAVRHKVLDALILLVLGGLLIFLAGSIPEQPGGF